MATISTVESLQSVTAAMMANPNKEHLLYFVKDRAKLSVPPDCWHIVDEGLDDVMLRVVESPTQLWFDFEMQIVWRMRDGSYHADTRCMRIEDVNSMYRQNLHNVFQEVIKRLTSFEETDVLKMAAFL
jgi:hypothetical protein